MTLLPVRFWYFDALWQYHLSRWRSSCQAQYCTHVHSSGIHLGSILQSYISDNIVQVQKLTSRDEITSMTLFQPKTCVTGNFALNTRLMPQQCPWAVSPKALTSWTGNMCLFYSADIRELAICSTNGLVYTLILPLLERNLVDAPLSALF